jgi:hypothetical protein
LLLVGAVIAANMNGLGVIKALADGNLIIIGAWQQTTDRTDMGGVILSAKGSVAQLAGIHVGKQVAVTAATTDAKNVFVILLLGTAGAQFAKNAAILIDKNIRMGAVGATLRIQLWEGGVGHAQIVGHRL